MILFTLVLTFCIATSALASLCPDGWDEVGGSQCVKYNDTLRNFMDTMKYCNSKIFGVKAFNISCFHNMTMDTICTQEQQQSKL